jgi:tRNA threonylcarbamoyl adenosine modification protein YeaZ
VDTRAKKLLALDTSGGVCSIACGVAGEVMAERSVMTQSSHFEVLDSLVGELLQSSGWGLADLQGIIVGAGPGSFTGLRIGYGYAKGLCCGFGLPMAAVSSFAAAAHAASYGDSSRGATAVVGVARRDSYFLGIFAPDGVPSGEIEDLSLESLRAKIGGAVSRIVTIGVPPDPIQNAFSEVVTEIRVAPGILGVVRTEMPNWLSGAEALAGLAPEYGQKVAAKTIAERRGL